MILFNKCKKTFKLFSGFGVLIFLCCWQPSQLSAQDSKKTNYSIGIEYLRGKLADHTPIIPEGLLNGNTNLGIKINFERNTYGQDEWQANYNYPDVGYSFLYWDYNNDSVGKSIAIIPYFNFYLNKKRPSKGNLKLTTGFGLAYHTNIYDEVENPLNEMLGSRLSFAINAELMYYYKISNSMALSTGVAFTHFSNGATKKPNLGTNMTSLNFGVTYLVNHDEQNYEPAKNDFKRKPIRFNIMFASGFQESYPRPRGAFPFYNIGVNASKRLSLKSEIVLGTELFLTQALKEDIEQIANGEVDYKRVGIFFGHDLIISKLSLVTQLGYYVYFPYYKYEDREGFGRFYYRLGVRYKINDHFAVGLTVKAFTSAFSKAAAEALEFSISYRL